MRPPDQDVRDRIVHARDVTLAVEAGAGTGKTRLLVDRVVARLEDGVPLQRLAVITFTKKAAAELVGRIRARLAARLDRPWAAAALDSFDLAEIGTTDSFCHALLSRFPLEAGAPPGFGIADEIAQEALRGTAWARFLEGHREQATRTLIRLRRAGAKPSTLRDLAESLVSNRDLPAPPIVRPDPGDLREEFERALAPALEAAPLCKDPDDLLLAHLRELRHDLEVARSLDGPPAERVLLGRKRAGRKYSSSRGRAAAWGGKHAKEGVTSALTALQERVDAWFHARGLGLAADAAAWASGYAREYERLKEERGLLDFRDLALRTRNLLRDRPRVRLRVAARYDEILMDEVQDTDPLQMEIAFLLAAEGDVPADPLDAKLVPGKLFLVGDPKQSIYRFRRADIELYERAVDRIRTDGEAPRIRANFRSRPGILRVVNHVFDRWMSPPEGVNWQARYEELVPALGEATGEPCVTLLLPDPAVRAELLRRAGTDAPRSEERRELEIDAVVRAIRAGLGEDGGRPWTTTDAEGADRPVRTGDIAVLVRKIEWGDRLLDALRHAGIPATSTGGRRYWAREEIQTLLALLESVARPDDDLARFGALRSLVFGLSDDDLVLRFLGADRPPAPVAEADRRLHALTDAARALPVPEFLEHLSEELCLLPTFGFRPDGAGRIESVRMLLESADSLVEAGFESLPEFVGWLRTQSSEPRAEGLGETESGDGGGVQILTMHKAKGLEFPVVLLADLAGEPRQDFGIVPDRAAGTTEFRLSRANGIATTGFAEASDLERNRCKAEDVRLLYVAMTRARDHLVLSWPEGKGGFLGDGVLAERVGSAPGQPSPSDDLRVLSAAGLPPLVERERLLTVDPERPRIPAETGPDRWPEARSAATRGRRVFAATRLRESAERRAEDAAPEEGGDRRGRVFGQLVHGALETFESPVRFDPERAVVTAAARLSREREETGGVSPPPGLTAEAVSYLRRVTADPAVVAVTKAPHALREVPFLVPLGDDFLSGTLDVLVQGSGGALSIVDWKTDRIGDRPGNAAKERYRHQALAYAWAAAEITGRPVHEVRFVFLSADPVRTGSFVVDREFLMEGRALLSRARMP